MATRKTRLNTDSPTPNSGSETTPSTPSTSAIKKRLTRKVLPKSNDDKEDGAGAATSTVTNKKSSILSPCRKQKLSKLDLIAQLEEEKLARKGKRLKRATIGSIVEFKSTRGKRQSLPAVVKKEIIKRRNSVDVIDRKQSARLNKDKALRSGRARKSVVSAPEKVVRVAAASRKRMRTATDKSAQAAKAIKIEVDGGLSSDSELLDPLPRSDSISKCSDQTDTSSIMDVPLNLLKEESLLMESQKPLLMATIKTEPSDDILMTADEINEPLGPIDDDCVAENGKISPCISDNMSEVTADVADVTTEDAKKEINIPDESKPIAAMPEAVMLANMNDSGIVGDSSDTSHAVAKSSLAVSTASTPVAADPPKKPKRTLIRPKFNVPTPAVAPVAPATPSATVTIAPSIPSKEVEVVPVIANVTATVTTPILLTEGSAVPDDGDANTTVNAPEGVDTSTAVAETTSAASKDTSKSPSPGPPISEGISAISVKQFYGQPDFLENNLGIEEDPKLAEIVQVHEKTKLTDVVKKETIKTGDADHTTEVANSESDHKAMDTEDTSQASTLVSSTEVLEKEDELKLEDSIESDVDDHIITEELSEAVLLEEDMDEKEDEKLVVAKIIADDGSNAVITIIANGVHVGANKSESTDAKCVASLKEEKLEPKEEQKPAPITDLDDIKSIKIEVPAKAEPMDAIVLPLPTSSAVTSRLSVAAVATNAVETIDMDTTVADVATEPENKENILSNFKGTAVSSNAATSPARQTLFEDRPKTTDDIKDSGSGEKLLAIAESPETRKKKETHLLTLGLLTHRAAVAAKIEKQKRREQMMSSSGSSSGKSSGKRSADYTGTLKTVIKLHRPTTTATTATPTTTASSGSGGDQPKAKKPGRPPGSLKMTLHKGRSKATPTAAGAGTAVDKETNSAHNSEEDTYYTIQNEARHGTDHAATHGGQSRKPFNRSHTGDGGTNAAPEPVETAVKETEKALVIPEKASSFRIHPDKLCQDQCFYCGGKFGLFDTPCHVASIKSLERQKKILDNEEKLTVDNCLCDACFRHVDRRANCPSYKKRIMAPSNTVTDFHSSLMQQQNHSVATSPNDEQPSNNDTAAANSGSSSSTVTATINNNNNTAAAAASPSTTNPNQIRATGCQVVDCTNKSSHVIRRKWLLKMRKQIGKLLNLNATPAQPITYLSICSNHYNVIGHLMVCTLCKRRLLRNHIYYITQSIPQLEQLLSAEGIPVTIGPSPVVCKLCRYFSNLLLKPLEQPQKTGFVREYKRRLLQFYNVEVMDETDTDSQPSSVTVNDAPQSSLQQHHMSPSSHGQQSAKKRRTSKRPRKSSRADDSMSLPSSVESVHEDDHQAQASAASGQVLIDHYDVQHMLDSSAVTLVHKPKSVSVQKAQQPAVAAAQKSPQVIVVGEQVGPNKEDLSMLRANPNISMRELFPGEEEMGLQVNVPFGSTHGHRTPEGWTKVVTTMQYDEPTRHLWEDLQKPYGNQSSFLRHLILLEKYFRNGDLILSANAGCNAVNYTDSVQHRLQSFDNVRRRRSSSDDASTPPEPVATVAASPVATTSDALNQMYNLSQNSPITIIPTGTTATSSSATGKAGKSKQSSATELTSLLKQQHYEQPMRSKRHSSETKAKSTGMPPELICINTSNKQPINLQQSIQQFVAAAAAAAAASTAAATLNATTASAGVSVSLQPTATTAIAATSPVVPGASSTTPPKAAKSSQSSLLLPQTTTATTSAGSGTKKSSTSSSSATKPLPTVAATVPATAAASTAPGSLTACSQQQNVIRLPDSLTHAERLESKTWRPTLMPVTAGPPAVPGQLFQTADGRKLPNIVQVQSGGNPYLISIHDYNRMCILRRERLLRDHMIQRNLGSAAGSTATAATATSSQSQQQLNQHLLLKQYVAQQQQQLLQQQQQMLQQAQPNQSKSSTVTKPSSAQPSGSGTNSTASATTPSTSTTFNSAKVNIPNKILEQNSVIPISNASSSKSSALDSLLKVRKSNPTSLLKPNMHIAPKSSQQPSSANAAATAGPSNVISITSTPSISSILSAQQQQQQQQQQHVTNQQMLQNQQLIQQHILQQQLSYQQQMPVTAVPPAPSAATSALDAMIKTTHQATQSKMWQWAESLSQNKRDTTAMSSSGSNVVIDNSAATLLSKIPKSLTVIPQQKHHRSSSSKSSGDGNIST